MQQLKTSSGKFGRKALSVLMAVVLALGMMPLPAFGEGAVAPGTPSGGVEALVAGQRVDYGAEYAEDADIVVPDDVAAMDFSTQRVIVGLSSGELDSRDADNVVAEGDGEYLLQYKNEESAQKAYMRYLDAEGVDYVAPDIVVEAADDSPNSTDADITEPTEAPLAAMAADNPIADDDSLKIALIDTGVPEGDSHVVAYRSALASGELYDDSLTRHGTKMLRAITAEEDNAQVISVKALDSDGVGTAATVKEGVEIALAEGADIINLSFSGKATRTNAAIAAAVNEAVEAGAIVIAAAGNNGDDASLYTPANAEGSFTVGAAANDGSRLSSSNYGSIVDAYVKASSTSRAASRVSGWLYGYLSAGGDVSEWHSALRASSIAGEWPSTASVSVARQDDDVVRAADDEDEYTVKFVLAKGATYTDTVYGDEVSNFKIKTVVTDKKRSTKTPSGYSFDGKWVYVPAGTTPSYTDGTATIANDANPFSSISPVDGETYTFYACWYQEITLNYLTKSPDKSYERRFIETESDGTRSGFLNKAMPTTDTSLTNNWSFHGWDDGRAEWKTLDPDTDWDGTLLMTDTNRQEQDASDIAKAVGTTNYYGAYSRTVRVNLGATGSSTTCVNTSVNQYHDGARDTADWFASSNLSSYNAANFVPSGSTWSFVGFQAGTAENSKGPDYAGTTFSGAMTALAEDAASLTGALTINAEFKRTVEVTLGVYVDGIKNTELTPMTQTQYYVARGTDISTDTQVYDAPFTFTDPGTWDAYESDGTWTVNGTTLDPRTDGDSDVLASNCGLSAKWNDGKPLTVEARTNATIKSDTYKVYYVDGVDNTIKTDTKPAGEATLDTTTTATREGWTFDHWVLPSARNTAVATVTSTTDVDVTVEAVWKRDATLHAGQSGTATQAQYWNPTAGTYTMSIPSGSLTALSGWTAHGWMETAGTPTSSSDATVAATATSYTNSSDNLYAVYSKTASLKYDGNKPSEAVDTVSGVPSNSSGTQVFRSGATTASASFPTVSSAEPTLSGYSFAGWYTAASGGTKLGGSYSTTLAYGTDEATVYAHWNPDVYTVRYMDGTSNVIGTEPETADQAHTLKANPTLVSSTYTGPGDGWTFAYWALASSPFTAVTTAPGQGSGKSIDVQAVWRKAATITSGSGATDTSQYQYWNRSGSSAGSYTLSIPDSALTSMSSTAQGGWTSIGWTTTASGEPTSSIVGTAARQDATSGASSGEWTRTSTGWTYTGSSNALYTVYSRSVGVTYNHVPGPAQSDVTNWKASDSTLQFYRSGDAATVSPTEVKFTTPTLGASGWNFNGWTETGGDGTVADNPYKKTPTLTTASPAYSLDDKWTEQTSTKTATYTVSHYKMGYDGKYTTAPSTVTQGPITVGTTLSGVSLADPPTGYEFDTSSPSSADVAEGGSTAFSIYYKLSVFRVSVPDQAAGTGTATFAVSSEHADALKEAGLSVNNGSGADAATAAAYGDKVTITPSLPEGYKVTGYTVSDARPTPTVTLNADGSGTFDMPEASSSVTGITVNVMLAKEDSNTTSYTVNHYEQELDGTTYKKIDSRTETVSGVTVGSSVTGASRSNPSDGFKLNEDADKTSGTVTFVSDASKNVVNVYYDRLAYGVSVPDESAGTDTVSFSVKSDHATALAASGAKDGPGTSADTKAAFGDTVTITPSSLPANYRVTGYTVGGVSPAPTVTVDANGVGTFTMPAASSGVTVTATVSYSSVSTTSYTVNHYEQELDGTTYKKIDSRTETVSGVTVGSSVTGASRSNPADGFVLNTDSDKTSGTVTFVSDASQNVVNVYYDRLVYGVSVPDGVAGTDTVTFSVASAKADVEAFKNKGAKNGPGTDSTTKATYGDTVTVTPSPLPDGYRVTGYTVGGVSPAPTVTVAANGVGTFTMPAAPSGITLTPVISYSSANTTSYTVNRYEQGLDGQYPDSDPSPETVSDVTVGSVVNSKDIADNDTPVGFEYDSSKSSGSVAIASGGASKVNVYYKRSIYRVSVPNAGAGAVMVNFKVAADHADDLGTHDGSGTASSTTAAYGDTVTITPENLPGDYKVIAYVVANSATATTVTLNSDGTGTFTMPAEQVKGLGITVAALIASTALSADYTIGHYKQELDGTYSTTPETEVSSGEVGADGTATPKSYVGFAPNATKAEYGKVADPEENPPTVKLYYDRVKYPVTAAVAEGSEVAPGIAISAAHATAMGSANGAGEGTAAYGDTVTVAPVADELPDGYAVTAYQVTDANGSVTVSTPDASGAATFEMPASAVTVTATVGLDPNYNRITVVTGEGVTATGTGSKPVAAAKAGAMVVLIARAQDGYSLLDGSKWTVAGATMIVNEPDVIAFTMPSSDVTVIAPPACTERVEKVYDASGALTSSTTRTAVYNPAAPYGDGPLTTVTTSTGGSPATTYERVAVEEDVPGVGQTRTTTIAYASDGTTVTGSEVVDDNGQGLSTTTRYAADGATVLSVLVAETSDLGGGTTSTSEEAYSDAAMTQSLAGWPRTIVTTTDEAGITTATATHESSSYVDTRETGTGSDEAYEITVTETAETWVSTTEPTSASATTTVTKEQDPEVTVVKTTYPVTATIGGTSWPDATSVVRTVNGVPEDAQYYRAWLKDETMPYTAGYASDDTSVAGADATITPSATGATVSLLVTPKGGSQVSGTSEMASSGRAVTGITASAGDVTASLSGRGLSRLDAGKYWYALVVRELPTADYSTAEKLLLKSDEHYSKISYNNRIFAVSLYRVATGKNGTVAGEVSTATSAELSGLSVSLGIGEANAGRQAYVTRVDGTSSAVLGYRIASAEGVLSFGMAGGLGDFVVGIGQKFTATYHDNYERTDNSIPQTAAKAWADGVPWSTQSSGQFERKYYALDSWNTEDDGSGVRYEAGAEGTPQGVSLTADIDLYAQWKADLSQTNVALETEGTHVALYSDADCTTAYGTPVYNTKSQHPYVKVRFNGEALTEGKDYSLSYLNAAGEAIEPSSVVDAGSYKVIVTGLAGDESAAFEGSAQEVAFSVAKASQTLMVPGTSYNRTYGDAGFSIASSAAPIPGGTPAGAVSYAVTTNVPATGTNASKNVVTVTAAGAVAITGAGSAKVTVKAAETTNYNAAFKDVAITVAKAAQAITAPKSFTLQAGKTAAVGAKLNNTEGALSYASAHNARLAMTADGKGTGVGCNVSTTITVTAAETANYKAAAAVKIPAKVTSGLKLKAVKATQKVKRSKKTVLKVAKAIKVSSNTTKGAVSYARSSIGAKAKKYVTVDKKGNITIKKGCPKGTYTLKVKGTAKAKSPYKAQTATVSIKLKVS